MSLEAETTHNSDSNARQRRYSTKAMSGRITVLLDHPADVAIELVQGALAGQRPGDVVSPSMIIRRALVVYGEHVARLRNNPVNFGYEFNQIRNGTILPYKRHRQKRMS